MVIDGSEKRNVGYSLELQSSHVIERCSIFPLSLIMFFSFIVPVEAVTVVPKVVCICF